MTPFRRLLGAAVLVALTACGQTPVGPGDDGGESETDGGGAGGEGGGAGGAGGAGGEGGSGGSGGGDPSCPASTASALSFDGVDDHVGMGAAPALGLEKFTLEAWVRRDGPGSTFGTGAGGITLVPIVGKGRGESDGSNVDCNYAFGFSGNVLGADFEDAQTGANHPVTGTTALATGTWHHVAATYDGASWRLYVDGRLDAERLVSAKPRADSIQHFGVGTAFDSKGAAAGHLAGAVDEVRVWNYARTEAELGQAMYASVAQAPGLVGRWGFSAGETQAVDSAGSSSGTIVGATHVADGPELDRGGPPALSLPSPAEGATVGGASTPLEVRVDDLDGDLRSVTFYARELTSADDFTIAVLPDTQYYTVPANNWTGYFNDQTQWVMANRATYNIVAVIHNGDIVDSGGNDAQWANADTAMKKLEVPAADLPAGMPYGVAVGNHDQSPNSVPDSTVKFNANFGVSRFASRAYYGGHYGTDNDESWFTFKAGGQEFVVVNVQFRVVADAAVIAWARSIFETHPTAFGILNSHYILGLSGAFGGYGGALYSALRDVQNLQLMTCGHIAGESRRSDTFSGHTIYSMLADYQGRANGGSGWMRLWEFSPANRELTVRTFSPSLNQWETDANSEFTIPVSLPNAGGPFSAVAPPTPSGPVATATFSGLKPSTRYEWYAVARDCFREVRTPVYAFKTLP